MYSLVGYFLPYMTFQCRGQISQEEFDTLQTNPKDDLLITNFRSHVGFCQRVVNEWDGIWLIEIIWEKAVVSENQWLSLQKTLSKFGVKFGRYYCQLNKRTDLYCGKRGWTQSLVTFLEPSTNPLKSSNCDPVNYIHSINTDANTLLEFIKAKALERVVVISDLEDLTKNWLQFPYLFDLQIRMLYISTVDDIPLLFSMQSLNYPNRVRLGIVKANTHTGKAMINMLHLTHLPSYMIITKHAFYDYGNCSGEPITFNGLSTFLTSIYPTESDLYTFRSTLINIYACLELGMTDVELMGRFTRCFQSLVICHIVHYLIWLVLFRPLDSFLSLVTIHVIRPFIMIPILKPLWNDMLYCYNNLGFTITVLLISIIIISFKDERLNDRSRNSRINFSERQQETNNEQMFHQNEVRLSHRPPSQERRSPIIALNLPVDSRTEIRRRQVRFLENPFSQFPQFNLNDSGEDNSLLDSTITTVPSRMHTLSTDRFHQAHPQDMISLRSELQNVRLQPNIRRTTDHEPRLNVSDLMAFFSDVDQSSSTPEYIRFLPVWEHQIEVICDGNCRWKERTETNESRRESIVYSASHSPSSCSISNINIMLHKPLNFMVDNRCSICEEEYELRETLRGLPCKHVFHDKCILHWLIYGQGGRVCPLCRAPANNYKGMHRDLQMNAREQCIMHNSC